MHHSKSRTRADYHQTAEVLRLSKPVSGVFVSFHHASKHASAGCYFLPRRRCPSQNIEHKLKSTYGKDANIYFSKDPSMMGGLSIKIGDETLDLSIKGKVKKLVNQLNF